MEQQSLAGVAVQGTSFHFDKLYTYLVPEAFRTVMKVGCRVLVPFGNGTSSRQGFVITLQNGAQNLDGRRPKEIAAVLDAEPVVDSNMIQLAEYMKAHTFCTLFDALKTMIPTGLNRKWTVCYGALPAAGPAQEPALQELTSQEPALQEPASQEPLSQDEKRVLQYLGGRKGFVKGPVIRADLGLNTDDDILERLYEDGKIDRDYDADRVVGDAMVKMVRLSDGFTTEEDLDALPERLTKKQRAVAEELLQSGPFSVQEICYATGVTKAVVRALEKKHVISLYEKETFRRPYRTGKPKQEPIVLTEEQETAYGNLLNQYRTTGGVSLLFGVTGSGKTQVYLKLIDDCLKDGRGVIVMVPEISLTPQMLTLFYARYGSLVAVFHSSLSQGERLDEWKRVRQGLARIAVGTRSAVFAPVERLGLIIMDEEQEHTYQSEQSPQYHARDIAKYRCAHSDALLLLSSATPSVESYAAAQAGTYTLNVLRERFGSAQLPEVKVVDMCRERSNGNKTQISRLLYTELMRTFEAGKQSILLMNRRGYNTYAACGTCGAVVMCPNCSISLTYHRDNNRLMCHYCGYSVPFTKTCSECGAEDVHYSGMGTQRIEEDLHQLMPNARILRMDADTTMQKYAYDEKLSSFRSGEYDIMLGTQMVAKGLDYETVTLVGVLSADRELYDDDYRSMERTFDLLTQVVGRAGRGKYPGKAIIQTINPGNDVIRYAANQDYEQFYRREITIRKSMVYPPFCSLVSLSFRGQSPERTQTAADVFMQMLRQLVKDSYPDVKLIALGPSPDRIFKECGKYRFHIVLKCRNDVRFRTMLAELLKSFGRRKEQSGVSTVVELGR